MAKHPFDVPPADGNPIDRRKLPKSRPTLRFPARFRAHDDFWPWLSGVFSWSIGLLVVSLAIFWWLAKTDRTSELYMSGLCLIALHLGSSAWTDRGFRFIPLLMAFPVILLMTPTATELPTWSPLALVFLCEGLRFRSHYLAHATSGFYDEKTVKHFYRTKRSNLKKSLIAVFPAVFDAFRSYAFYNFHHFQSPGLFQSPAGPAALRWVRVLAIPLLVIPLFPAKLVTELERGVPSVLYLVCVAVLPVIAWCLVCCVSIISFASEAYALKRTQMHPILWQQLKNRLNTSNDPLEKASVYLGSVDLEGAPILFPVEQGYPHIRLTGATGSGKTAYLLSLIDQIIARRDTSILYIDLKATSFEPLAAIKHFEALAQATRQPRIPVKCFTPDMGLETFVYDVFGQPWWQSASVPQKSATVLSVASLIYSRAYGPSYFTDAAYHVVQYVFSRDPHIASWKELEQGLQGAFRYAKPHEIPQSTKNDCTHVYFIVARLAQITAINPGAAWSTVVKNSAISFDDMFAKPNILYASLSQMRHPLLAGELGRLLAGSALHAAAALSPSQRKTKLVIIIDEWQAMVADSLDVFLTQSRALGIGVVLANQNTAQLNQGTIDLTSVIQGNTSVQCWFQVTDAIGRVELRDLGGKYRRWAMSYTTQRRSDGWQRTQTAKETIEDRLHPNIVSEVGSDKSRFFIRITNNAGYAAFNDLIFVARMAYNLSPTEYQKMVHSKWPHGMYGTLVNTLTNLQSQQAGAFHAQLPPQSAVPLTARVPPQTRPKPHLKPTTKSQQTSASPTPKPQAATNPSTPTMPPTVPAPKQVPNPAIPKQITVPSTSGHSQVQPTPPVQLPSQLPIPPSAPPTPQPIKTTPLGIKRKKK